MYHAVHLLPTFWLTHASAETDAEPAAAESRANEPS